MLSDSETRPARARRPAPSLSDLRPFWVTGLALLILLAGSRLRLEGESFDWTEYLLLGTLFPAILLAASLLERARAGSSAALRAAFYVPSALAVLLVCYLLVRRGSYFAAGAGLVQYLLMRHFAGESRSHAGGPQAGPLRVSLSFLAAAAGWLAASRLIWWAPAKDWIGGSNYVFVVFILTLLLVVAALYDEGAGEAKRTRRSRLWSAGNVVALLLVGMASLRTDKIFNPGEIHHWSFFTGPAQLVRQGGWLLWDVPSQYGFLSTLAVAWAPFKSVWQSLFTLNALFNFLTAAFIFLLFRSLRRESGANLIFSLLLALSAVFFRAGLNTFFEGPTTLPNTGGMRFIWCLALLALLLWEYHAGQRGRASSRRFLLAGSVLWLIGFLWSSESAVYCSVTWLPAYAVLVWRRATSGAETRRLNWRAAREMVPWLALPAVLLLLAAALVWAVYYVGLGHGPDWVAFVEYALSYKGGFSALPVEVSGPVWVLVLVFCAAATALYYQLAGRMEATALPLLAGALGCLWATSSYFVSRSHPTNVHNLAPVFCIVIGLLLYLFAREARGEWWHAPLRAGFVPVLVMVIIATFGAQGSLWDYLSSPQGGYTEVDRLIPLIDTNLDELMATAGVKPTDPMIYVGQDKLLVFFSCNINEGGRTVHLTSPRGWLPALPPYSLVPLPEDRREVYMTRFADRAREGGWLIEFKEAEKHFPWLLDFVGRRYTPARTFENERWRLTWYDFKG